MSLQDMVKWTAEQAVKQANQTYSEYKKIIGFEDVGYLLLPYVIEGGVTTANVASNNVVDVSNIVVSLNDDIMARNGASFKTEIANTIYYLDFTKDGDWHFGTVTATGVPELDYLPIAEVSTDSNAMVVTITDTRGNVGGFKLKSEFGLDGFAKEEDVDLVRTEVDDARGEYPLLSERLDTSDSQLEGVDLRLNGVDSHIDNVNSRLDNVDSRLDDVDSQVQSLFNVFNPSVIESVKEKMFALQNTKIVCFGDSITYGYKVGTGAQVADPYPKELQAKLRQLYAHSNISVVNKGFSGWRSTEALGYVQDIINENADAVIVMYGMNDFKGSSFGSVVPVDTFRSNMKEIVTRLKESGVCIIICTVTPYLVNFNSKKLIPYNDAIKSIAKEFNLELIDMHAEVETIYQQRFISDVELLPDGIHLADAYYKCLAHIVLKTFWEFPELNQSHPLIYSKHMQTDSTNLYTSLVEQFYKYNWILRGGGSPNGTYIRFFIFNDKKSTKLYMLHPKTNTGTNGGVRLDGTVVATISHYNATNIVDIETLISDNISYGFHVIEMLIGDITAAGTGGGWNTFISAFVFK